MRPHIRTAIAGIIIATATLTVPSPSAAAVGEATVIVGNEAELRNAVDTAAGPTKILLEPGTPYVLTDTLTLDTASMTIVGVTEGSSASASSFVIEAAGTRAFDVKANQVTLRGITIRNAARSNGSGAAINVKKGQFLAPWDMPNVAAKIASTGNARILLCERGSSFGYNTLVADMRSLPQMERTGYPVVMDATHSVQQPGGLGGASGGQREFAPVMARAAVAIGVAAVFIETHPDPDRAPSDGPNMIPLERMPALIAELMAFDRLAKEHPLDV